MDRLSVVDVALDARSGGAEALYTYRNPPRPSGEPGHRFEVGDACFVPLGNRPALGYVVAAYETTAGELGFPVESLREPTSKVEGLSLPASVIDLVRFVAQETLCPLPVALTAATPPGVRDRIVSAWRLIGEPAPADLTAAQSELVRVMRESNGVLLESPSKKLAGAQLRSMKLLRAKGWVQQELRIAPPADRRKTEELLRLNPDTGRIEEFLKNEGRKRPAQALVLMRLMTVDHPALSAAEIKGLAQVTDSTLRALVECGLLERVDPDQLSAPPPPPLNPYQQLALDAVVDAIHSREPKGFLLFGVTGSGKTEVYLRASAEALRLGRRVLYVVPEIALAAQAISQVRERFGRNVAVAHSDLAPAERLANWMRIRNGAASVVLGARSALFAPVEDVGLILLDEEHEASYKQETAPRYHAKAVAKMLAERHGCPVVFGSATPSVESFFEAEQERLTLLSLPERARAATLPTVFVEDLKFGYQMGRPALLSEDLQTRLRATLDRKEQAILFLNRRAYSSFLVCRECGFRTECPSCAVTLSFHRYDARIKCHHCGFQQPAPEVCPACGGSKIAPFGIGTERVEEAVSELFPDAVVARLDRDVAQKRGALEEVLARFRSGEVQVLVGTQMVAKGLDFPNVTLVGVIAADVSLNIPDFRASERTFQLLSQVAGRAGRGDRPGEVVIQTFNPDHVSVQSAQDHHYVAFFEAMREERRQAAYPPFTRLVNVLLTSEDRRRLAVAGQEAGERLRRIPGVQVLGPVDCPIEKIQDRYRRHLLVKLPAGASAIPVGAALEGFDPQDVQVVLDVDAYSLM